MTFSQLQINVLVLVPLLGSYKKEFLDTTYLFVTINLFSISFTCGTPGKYLPHLTRTTEETTKRQKKFTLASHMQRKTEKKTFPYKRPTNYQEEESFCRYLQKIHHIYICLRTYILFNFGHGSLLSTCFPNISVNASNSLPGQPDHVFCKDWSS